MSSEATLNSIKTSIDKCGKVVGIVMMVCCVVSSIILFIVGNSAIKESKLEQENTQKVLGTVIKVNNQTCTEVIIKQKLNTKVNYDCNLVVKYTFNNKEYTTKIFTTDKLYVENDTIDLLVNNNDPTKVFYYNQVINTKLSGSGYIIVAIFILVLCLIHTILYYKLEWYRLLICSKGIFSFLRF